MPSSHYCDIAAKDNDNDYGLDPTGKESFHCKLAELKLTKLTLTEARDGSRSSG